jgi:hypothetical protein
VAYKYNAPLRAEVILGEREVFPKAQSGIRDWVASRIGKEPKLVSPPNLGILEKS